MNPKRFPLLVDLGRAARSSVSVKHALEREELDAQEEIRTEAREAGDQTPISGVILPWYVNRERRDMTATGDATAGGNLVASNEVIDLGAGLRSQLVLERLGARIYGGLKSNVMIGLPNTLIAADWKSENADAPDGTFTYRGLNLAPKRCTAYVDVSWQLLMQGQSAENHIRLELMAALADAIQRKAINGTGADSQPLGILNTPNIGSVVGGTNGAAPDYEDITQLEYLVGQANDRERTGWLVSPLARRKLRRTAMFADGSTPIWPADQARALLGHPAGVVTSVPDNLTKGSSNEVCSAIIHGSFTELFVGLWGPGISVDAVPVGGHTLGKTRFVATAFVDSGVRAAEAFAAMQDALCAA